MGRDFLKFLRNFYLLTWEMRGREGERGRKKERDQYLVFVVLLI